MKISRTASILGLGILCFSLGNVFILNAIGATTPVPETLYENKVETITGEKVSMEKYKGKVLLIVNTASKCGFTPQYAALEKTYEKFSSQGFEILGFPSNNFGAQEPGTNAEIKTFCELTYKVKFPMFVKGDVGGKDDKTGEDLAQPVYRHLLKYGPTHEAISWNFEKYLIGKDGKILGRYKSKVKPDSEELTKAIEAALAAK